MMMFLTETVHTQIIILTGKWWIRPLKPDLYLYIYLSTDSKPFEAETNNFSSRSGTITISIGEKVNPALNPMQEMGYRYRW